MLKLDCIIPLHFPPLHWGKGRTKKPKQAPDVTSELFSEAKQFREALGPGMIPRFWNRQLSTPGELRVGS